MPTLRSLVVVAALAGPMCADAQSSFRVTQVFSNLDGSIQFIALTESEGLDGQSHFKGLTLTVTRADRPKRFTFYDDLATSATANKTFIVAAVDTPGYPTIVSVSSDAVSRPDFIVPARFVPADGGTIDLAGFDTVTYPRLPADGSTAWYRDGRLAAATLPGNYGCPLSPSSSCPGTINPTATKVLAREYYNSALDHYFVTAAADEIEALDDGRIVGWRQTGKGFPVGQVAETALAFDYIEHGDPVCRFYLPPSQGDSHFLSASSDECGAVRTRFPAFVEESAAAFYVPTPNEATGACPVLQFIEWDYESMPVYRLWNQRADSNHRYTTEPAVRAEMIARGWLSEGYGPLGAVMCF